LLELVTLGCGTGSLFSQPLLQPLSFLLSGLTNYGSLVSCRLSSNLGGLLRPGKLGELGPHRIQLAA
jgi:hypothetical protein